MLAPSFDALAVVLSTFQLVLVAFSVHLLEHPLQDPSQRSKIPAAAVMLQVDLVMPCNQSEAYCIVPVYSIDNQQSVSYKEYLDLTNLALLMILQ